MERDGKACSIIKQLIRPDLQDVAKREMTSKELWDAIAAKYSRASMQESGTILRSLITRKYVDGESMTAHTRFFREQRLLLSNTDFYPHNKVMVCYLLESLPSSWNPTKQSVIATPARQPRLRLR